MDTAGCSLEFTILDKIGKLIEMERGVRSSLGSRKEQMLRCGYLDPYVNWISDYIIMILSEE